MFQKTAATSKGLHELSVPAVELKMETIEIILGLHYHFTDKKILLWLLTKNPNFGNISPLRLMQLGRGHKVLEFIKNAEDGIFP